MALPFALSETNKAILSDWLEENFDEVMEWRIAHEQDYGCDINPRKLRAMIKHLRSEKVEAEIEREKFFIYCSRSREGLLLPKTVPIKKEDNHEIPL